MRIYTIGHSTRTIEDFINILKHYSIGLVVDVRIFPGSRKFPWFGRDEITKSLNENEIEYLHYPELGGFRKGGYAAFTETEEFENAINTLVHKIDDKIAAILCAERFFWRCHRKYIANELVRLGYDIVHILDKNTLYEHKLKSKEITEKMNLVVWCDKKAEKTKT